MKINLSDVKIHPSENFRKDKVDAVDKILETMEEEGRVVAPIVVDQDNVLIAGECRYRAAKKLGWEKIDAHRVKTESKDHRVFLGIIDNLKRSDYLAGERAEACRWLRENWYKKGEINKGGRGKTSAPGAAVSEKIKKDTGMAERTFQQNASIGKNMSKEVKKALDAKRISLKQAEIICKEKNKTKQNELLRMVEGKTVEETKKITKQKFDADNGLKPVKDHSKSKSKVEGTDSERWLKSLYQDMSALSAKLKQAFEYEVWNFEGVNAGQFPIMFAGFVSDILGFKKKSGRDYKLIGG